MYHAALLACVLVVTCAVVLECAPCANWGGASCTFILSDIREEYLVFELLQLIRAAVLVCWAPAELVIVGKCACDPLQEYSFAGGDGADHFVLNAKAVLYALPMRCVNHGLISSGLPVPGKNTSARSEPPISKNQIPETGGHVSFHSVCASPPV